MGTRMCLAWCNLAGKGGHSQSGLDSVANLHLPACAVVPDRLWASNRAGGAWLSLPRPVGVSLGKADLVLVQQTLWPQADGDGCGFPFSPPFLLAEAHGWGELCVAHCGRISPLGITFWHGDPRRHSSPAAASCKCSSSAHGGVASPPGPAQGTGAAGSGLCASACLLEGCTEEGMFWQWLEVGFALSSSPGKLLFRFLLPIPVLVPGREQAR